MGIQSCECPGKSKDNLKRNTVSQGELDSVQPGPRELFPCILTICPVPIWPKEQKIQGGREKGTLAEWTHLHFLVGPLGLQQGRGKIGIAGHEKELTLDWTWTGNPEMQCMEWLQGADAGDEDAVGVWVTYSPWQDELPHLGICYGPNFVSPRSFHIRNPDSMLWCNLGGAFVK